MKYPWEEDCGQTLCTSSVETLGKWMAGAWKYKDCGRAK